MNERHHHYHREREDPRRGREEDPRRILDRTGRNRESRESRENRESRSRSEDKRRERQKRPSRFDDQTIPPEDIKPIEGIIEGEEEKEILRIPKRKSRWSEQVQDTGEKTAGLEQTAIDASMLDKVNQALLTGAPLISFTDNTKLRRKVYLPIETGVNYIGLLIGPKGMYQKRLEEQTGCKILIRGRGSQKEGQPPQPDDDDEQHVLIVGDSELSVDRAVKAINAVVHADEKTRNAIRHEQLRAAQELNTTSTNFGPVLDDSILTPYGPPSPYACIIPVPNEYVGLIIGKGGETIRRLQIESGAKVQVAKKEITETGIRNVFVEGPPDKFDAAKRMIENIIEEHRRSHIIGGQGQAPSRNPPDDPNLDLEEFPVPNSFIGLVIGKGGDTLKSLMRKTGAHIFVPKETEPPEAERILQIRGTMEQIGTAKREIALLTATVKGGRPNPALHKEMIAAQHSAAYSMMPIYGGENRGEDHNNKGNTGYSQNMQDWIAAGYDPHTGEFPGESAPDKSSHDSGYYPPYYGESQYPRNYYPSQSSEVESRDEGQASFDYSQGYGYYYGGDPSGGQQYPRSHASNTDHPHDRRPQ